MANLPKFGLSSFSSLPLLVGSVVLKLFISSDDGALLCVRKYEALAFSRPFVLLTSESEDFDFRLRPEFELVFSEDEALEAFESLFRFLYLFLLNRS